MKRIEIGMFAATLVIAGVALAGDVECWANETFSPDGKNVIRLYANPLTYEVKAGEKIPFHMAPGGGFVARCSRMSP